MSVRTRLETRYTPLARCTSLGGGEVVVAVGVGAEPGAQPSDAVLHGAQFVGVEKCHDSVDVRGSVA